MRGKMDRFEYGLIAGEIVKSLLFLKDMLKLCLIPIKIKLNIG